MTQPKFAPILPQDEVRDLHKLPPPAGWYADRPADFRPAPGAAAKPGRGIAGPDQGYCMLLAAGFAGRLRLEEGEHEEDVLEGACVIALKRAATFGRAPVSADLEVALGLFDFLTEAAPNVVSMRRDLFTGVAHDYWKARELADLLPTETIRLSPAALAERLGTGPGAIYELCGMPEEGER